MLLGLVLLLFVSLVCGVGLGAAGIGTADMFRFLWAGATGGTVRATDAAACTIVWEIRLPRVVLAAVVGAGLSAVGVAVQAMVRNALADPFVLGISSGAAVGADAVILLGAFAGLGVWALSASAFASALAAMVLVYAVARSPQGLTPLRLILTGTALAYGFEAVTTVMVFGAARGEAARSAMMWLLGSLGGATWAQVPPSAVAVAAGWAWLRWRAESLNALAMGDETSAALGVQSARLRRELFLATAVVTGTVVAVSGAIGFIGLMVPQLVRMLVGADHLRVLAVAPLAGAVLLGWADVLSRLLLAPAELPVGVITAVVGVTAFLLVMRRGGYAFGGALMRLDIEGLSVDAGAVRLVDDIRLGVDSGAFVGLVGPNGSGKSTLLRCVYRALRPAGGAVRLDGDDVHAMEPRAAARKLAALPQESSAEFDFTVAEVVAMGRLPHRDRTAASDRGICAGAMERTGVAHLTDRGFLALSGGEKRRVLIARALARRPRVLVLDEPTNHLDIAHQLDVLSLVRGSGLTVLAALHDLNLAAAHCDLLYVIANGRIVASGSTHEVLQPALLAEVFGVRAHPVRHPETGAVQLLFDLLPTTA